MAERNQDPLFAGDDDPQALSEAQLRRLYDEEEVERFMSLFSAHVTEVRLSTSKAGTESIESQGLDTATASAPSTAPLPSPTDCSLSEYIAHKCLLPYLPPTTGTVTPAFTLQRLSLTSQRLYLATFPPYQAFLSNLAQLALWKDRQRSLIRCTTFWFLWFHDLLLPALVFRIIFGLLRRRIFAFPTLKELRERRQESVRALKFGEALQQRLSAKTLGPIEMWRLFKIYKSSEKGKTKFVVQDTTETDEEENNFKRSVLHALNELADLHERVKNIFTWRRPDVSRRYLLILIILGLGALLLPARYVAKLVYGFGGILFWHVTPVVAALPRADRTRISVPLSDAPTDADYAMELIAKRIAAGQGVSTSFSGDQRRRAPNAFASTDDLRHTVNNTRQEAKTSGDDGINWKKWGERVARGKAFLEDSRQLLSTRNLQGPNTGEAAAICRPGDTRTFLAQYTSLPGLITLTPCSLVFTSLTGTRARLVVPRERLRGVRRSGVMKGISITWAAEEQQPGAEEREERFHWVGDRDELFALLVGSDGGRWTRV